MCGNSEGSQFAEVSLILLGKTIKYAGVAQLVEQLICNQQVAGSSPITSSKRDKNILSLIYGRVPEWPKGADCKSVVFDFNGSNPFSPTTSERTLLRSDFCLHKN